jgi:predicted SnoaL-like aldol condensation-catalyzing enzyme
MWLSLLLSMVVAASASAGEVPLNAKQIVVDFFRLALLEGQVDKAFDQYVGDTYIQHNPQVGDGPEGARAFLKSLRVTSPDLVGEIVRVIAEDDLMVLHIRWRWPENGVEKQAAGIDIFRVAGGKVVEHWDVNQLVPEESVNDNTMF